MAEAIQKQQKTKGRKMTQEIRETLKNAKKYLQRGELKQVAEEVGVGEQSVTDVLAGKYMNWDVVNKVIARAEANKAILERGKSL
jgi:hypothetical protein